MTRRALAAVAPVALALLAATGAPAGAAPVCGPSATLPGTDLTGRVVPSALRVVGAGPIVAGPFSGRRALLPLTPELGSKFFFQLERDGPRGYVATIRRLDAPGDGRFEVRRTDAGGRSVRRYVRVLRLDRARVARENPPRRSDTLLGQPGAVRLPAGGCYLVRVRWPGGAWARRFVAREAPAPPPPGRDRHRHP